MLKSIDDEGEDLGLADDREDIDELDALLGKVRVALGSSLDPSCQLWVH